MSGVGRPTVGISLAPSKTPTVKQQQAAAAARKQPSLQQATSSSTLQSQHSIDNALHDLNALHLSGNTSSITAAASVSAASDASVHGSVLSDTTGDAAPVAAKSKVPWRPLSSYTMEPDLQRYVQRHPQAGGAWLAHAAI